MLNDQQIYLFVQAVQNRDEKANRALIQLYEKHGYTVYRYSNDVFEEVVNAQGNTFWSDSSACIDLYHRSKASMRERIKRLLQGLLTGSVSKHPVVVGSKTLVPFPDKGNSKTFYRIQ